MIDWELYRPNPVLRDFNEQFIERNFVCANCGFEFSEYLKSERLGCSKCYDAFHDKIAAIVRQIHGTTKHNGSRP